MDPEGLAFWEIFGKGKRWPQDIETLAFWRESKGGMAMWDHRDILQCSVKAKNIEKGSKKVKEKKERRRTFNSTPATCPYDEVDGILAQDPSSNVRFVLDVDNPQL